MTIRSRLAWRTKAIRRADSDSLSFWLQDRGSLTARLQAKGTFSVELLQQSLAKPTLDEAVALGIARKQLAWIREVALLCDGEPLVFADEPFVSPEQRMVNHILKRAGLLPADVSMRRAIADLRAEIQRIAPDDAQAAGKRRELAYLLLKSDEERLRP